MTNKLKPNQTFLGIFTVQNDNRIKISKAQQLKTINQFKTKWTNIPSRQLARGINNSELIIK